MKKLAIILLITALTFSCKDNKNVEDKVVTKSTVTQNSTDDYEIIKPETSKQLLILFPGAGANAQATKEEFKVVEKATTNNIALLLLNSSGGGLWTTNEGLSNFEKIINKVVKQYKLPKHQVYIGGMSIGGNTALAFSEYLIQNKSAIQPKGAFIVDSPLDLYALYESSVKDVNNKDLSEERLQEPKFIINFFEEQFGKNDSLLTNIQNTSLVTVKTENLKKISNLKDIKIQLYTEPDSVWLKKVRNTDFKSSNAYTIQQTFDVMQKQGWENSSLIQTKDKGYRANGERNPHSWSIVDVGQLIEWMSK